AIGHALIQLHHDLRPPMTGRARAFLLRKAALLLDGADPDRGHGPIGLVTSGSPADDIPATVLAAALARAGSRMLTPPAAISSLPDISDIRSASPNTVILVNLPETDPEALRPLLPETTIRTWQPATETPEAVAKALATIA